MAAIAAEGRGIVLYLRGHEGRGIGLLSKLRAYQLQDGGADTVDANLELGLPVDAREYSTGAQILADLGVSSLRLLTNNPAKVQGLSGFGIKVTGRVGAARRAPRRDNLRYLIAKRDRLGHQLDGLVRPSRPASARRPPAGGHRRLSEAGVSGAAARRAVVDAAGLSLAIAATRWHAEVTDVPGRPGRGRRARLRRAPTRWWSGCPAPSSCPSSRPSWPGATTRWPAWARSSAAARRTSSTSATR